jgi:hypothetical protein
MTTYQKSKKNHILFQNIHNFNIDSLPKPCALDLYCGVGGASYGLKQAGFKTIVGIDIITQDNYPINKGFFFLKADCFDLPMNFLKKFDFIWASPPCQMYTGMVTATQRLIHQEKWNKSGLQVDLIKKTRSLLDSTKLAYIIENVPGASKELIKPIALCGTMFSDLKVFRRRLFESNIVLTPKLQKCPMKGMTLGYRGPKYQIKLPVVETLRKGFKYEMPKSYTKIPFNYPSRKGKKIDYAYQPPLSKLKTFRSIFKRNHVFSLSAVLRFEKILVPVSKEQLKVNKSNYEIQKQRQEIKSKISKNKKDIIMFPIYGEHNARGSIDEWKSAMSIPWAKTKKELSQAIPPQYSEFLGKQILKHVKTR